MTQTQNRHDLELLNLDPWLVPYEWQVRNRFQYYKNARRSSTPPAG